MIARYQENVNVYFIILILKELMFFDYFSDENFSVLKYFTRGPKKFMRLLRIQSEEIRTS